MLKFIVAATVAGKLVNDEDIRVPHMCSELVDLALPLLRAMNYTRALNYTDRQRCQTEKKPCLSEGFLFHEVGDCVGTYSLPFSSTKRCPPHSQNCLCPTSCPPEKPCRHTGWHGGGKCSKAVDFDKKICPEVRSEQFTDSLGEEALGDYFGGLTHWCATGVYSVPPPPDVSGAVPRLDTYNLTPDQAELYRPATIELSCIHERATCYSDCSVPPYTTDAFRLHGRKPCVELDNEDNCEKHFRRCMETAMEDHPKTDSALYYGRGWKSAKEHTRARFNGGGQFPALAARKRERMMSKSDDSSVADPASEVQIPYVHSYYHGGMLDHAASTVIQDTMEDVMDEPETAPAHLVRRVDGRTTYDHGGW